MKLKLSASPLLISATLLSLSGEWASAAPGSPEQGRSSVSAERAAPPSPAGAGAERSAPQAAAPAAARAPWPMPTLLVEEAKRSADRGLHFLRYQQGESGAYGDHVGLTAMVLIAFAESHRAYRVEDGPFISLAVRWLLTQARADGAITGEATPTYNTALAIMALHALDAEQFRGPIEAGQRFLVRFQSDEEQQYERTDRFYGGIGYGGDERPDLSNLQYALEALRRTDYDAESDVWEKAEVFISRCQNFSEGEEDRAARPWAGNDGGFVYAPGQSPAGGTTSYGAMTFAGLKSLIFTRRAAADDPRVAAAWGWIQRHYDFNEHPGMGTTAYYYYLQTAASALEAYGERLIPAPDQRGEGKNWSSDLLTKLLNLQRQNGSWQNENRRYWEGNPLLTTARAVITINHSLRAAGAQR